MRKIVLTSVLLTTYFLCFSQVDKHKVIGDWLRIKTETLEEKETKGKFGYSSEYLRISIKKNKMSFGMTPYDKGVEFDYDFDKDTIEMPFKNPFLHAPETYYFIENINDSILKLKTLFENSEIRYIFKNQKIFHPVLIDSLYQFNNDTIFLIRIPLSTPGYYDKTFVSKAFSNNNNFIPRPIYNNSGGSSFGYYMSWNLKYDEKIVKFKFSKPIKISFLIDYKGRVSNIQLLESFNDFYDKQIIKLVTKTNKDWIPNIISNPNNYVKMIFTFVIIDKNN